MVKAIYGDKTDLLQRESMGVITNDLQSVFKQKYVDQMFEKQPYELKKNQVLYLHAATPMEVEHHRWLLCQLLLN